MLELKPQAISREAFAPYGDLIETGTTSAEVINAGTAHRYHDLTRIWLTEAGAQACVHIYRSTARRDNIEVRALECHPFGSQLFMPLERQSFIAVVAPAGAPPLPTDVCAFIVNGACGINLSPGIWHHPLLSLTDGDYLVVERANPNQNLEVATLGESIRLIAEH